VPELTVFGELFFGGLALIVGGLVVLFAVVVAVGAAIDFAKWMTQSKP
jgi:hypothetical protein